MEMVPLTLIVSCPLSYERIDCKLEENITKFIREREDEDVLETMAELYLLLRPIIERFLNAELVHISAKNARN